MLNPGVVGVVHRRHPEFPAHVLRQMFATPIAHVGLEGVGDVFQEDGAEAESVRTGPIVFRPFAIGCRHCLLGGVPKLGFEVEAGVVTVGIIATHE